MYQNYNYYPQQVPQGGAQPYYPQSVLRQAPMQNVLKGRLVSSLEEARATSIDFDGTIFYFPDLANKRIYTKQINIDGTATLNMYELRELPTFERIESVIPSIEKFVTKDELEQVLADFRQSLIPQTEPVTPQKTEILSF